MQTADMNESAPDTTGSTQGLGWLSAGFATLANVLNWLSVPDHMAYVAHGFSALAAIVAIILGSYRLWDLHYNHVRRRK